MDLQRIRSTLPLDQQTAIDLDAAWRRYRGGGGLDDEASFEAWLAEQYPEVFDPHRTLAHVQVEVSIVMPSRFIAPGGDTRTMRDDGRTLTDAEAPTVRTERSQTNASTQLPAPTSTGEFHYVILGTAGKGGMGTVHIARDTELLRRVALKELSPEADVGAGARTRFLREVQITAQLDHPNIVPVYALEVAPGGTPAYTMKFVEGRTFHSLLNEARDFFESKKQPDETRTLAARLEHFLKVCDAIAYAHDKGVIHRDLKPANLMLGRHNEVYVMDWGLCRVLRLIDEPPADKSVVMSTPDISGSASETQIGDVVGTPKYMSPEQAQGRNHELDARSDQCALGLILYEMATLNPPYDGRTAYEVLVNAAAGKRRAITHAYMNRPIPRDLRAIIERSTALLPEQRYATVADMAADLRRFLRSEAVHARPDNLWQRAQRLIARNRQRVLTGILALIAVTAVAIGGLLWQNQRLFTAERLREQRLLQFQNAVDEVGGRVQTRMLQLEGAMQNMADSVNQINEFGRPGENRFYLLKDFRDAAKAPPDLMPNKTYGGRVSLNWPVWTIPPGMSEKDALPTIRKLSSLQNFRRDLYLRVAAMIKHKESDMYTVRVDDVDISAAENNPLAAIMLAFADGIASRYPGWDALPDNYDPRQHPWFNLAVNKRGPQWGDPYRSSVTGEMELPLSIPLYEQNGKFVGVVSALLLPDLMLHTLLDIDGVAGLRGVFLLDGDGDILASVGRLFRQQQQTPDEASAQVFPLPALLERLKKGQTGIFETTLRGDPVVMATDNVVPLGWHVVSVADSRALLKDKTQDTQAY